MCASILVTTNRSLSRSKRAQAAKHLSLPEVHHGRQDEVDHGFPVTRHQMEVTMIKFLVVALGLMLPIAAHADEQFAPAFDLRGPDAVPGVVIWSDGLANWAQRDAALGSSPQYL